MRPRLAVVAAALATVAVVAAAGVALTGATGAGSNKATATPGALVLPRGWPATVVLGLRDPEDGAAELRRQAPLGLRYTYLSGGANTGQGWQTFAGGDGAFVGRYVADSQASGFLTLFSYYMLLQSAPANVQRDERLRTTVNLASRPTMTAWFADLRAFFRRAAATGVQPIVLHMEPDAWGYAQRSATGDDARTVPAQVAATGLPELAGLPNDVSGVARAIVRLRDRYARNVALGYHVSVWGTGDDISFSDPPDHAVDALAARSAAFYRSLRAGFDLLFFEFADRDAGYREHVDGAGRAGWWDAADFRRNQRYVGRVTAALRRPGVLWQIPLGNTLMRAVDNTRGHYQDNRVQHLLAPSRTHLERYRDAGIAAFAFGHALDGATCACDASRDGVTNPAAINGNGALSLSADDDGGLFKRRVRLYAAQPPLAATAVPAAAWATFGLRAAARPRPVRRGARARVTATVTASATSRASLALEIRGPGRGGPRRLRRAWAVRSFERGAPRSFALTWRVPANAPAGRYVVVVQVTERRGSQRRTTTRRPAAIVVER